VHRKQPLIELVFENLLAPVGARIARFPISGNSLGLVHGQTVGVSINDFEFLRGRSHVLPLYRRGALG
jgi:hypothetical protein